MRTTLYNEKNKYQLRKIAEGLNDFNIVRVNNSRANDSGPASSIMSPQAIKQQP